MEIAKAFIDFAFALQLGLVGGKYLYFPQARPALCVKAFQKKHASERYPYGREIAA
jgi:hypothetical protein